MSRVVDGAGRVPWQDSRRASAVGRRGLFRAAEALGVDCITHDACTPANIPTIFHLLQGFIERVDHLYITVDLDGFSSAYAPGVSAPSAVGFSPEFFFPIFKRILASGKVLSVDIAEYNPTYDQDGVTAKLAARVVAMITEVLKE